MRKFKKKKFYRINEYIQAKEVRVIDEDGKQIGVMFPEKALSEARNRDLDLVEIAPKANPPVCKIIDFKKFRYLESKKQSAQKVKKRDIKKIRLNLFIAENDLNIRLEKAKSFLKARNQVKVSILFRGREIAKKELGYKLVSLITEKLSDYGQVSQEPKLIGRQLVMILIPYEKTSQKAKTENKKIN